MMTPNKNKTKNGHKAIANLKALALACLFLSPIWSMLIELFKDETASGELFFQAFSVRRIELLLRSTFFAMLTGITAISLSLILTIYIIFSNRKKIRLERIQYISVSLFLIPPCIHVQSWLLFFKLSRLPLQGFIPALWVSGVYYLPCALLLLTVAAANIPTQEIEAAKLFMQDRDVALRMILPALKPAVTAAWLIISLLSLGDYSIPSLFNVNVTALDIVSEYSFSGYSLEVIITAFPIIVLGCALMAAGVRPLIKTTMKAQPYQLKLDIKFGMPTKMAYYTALGIIGLSISLLSMNLLIFVYDFTSAGHEVLASLKPLANSLLLSIGASLITQIAAYLYAKQLLRSDHLALYVGLLFVPFILPPALLGVSMLHIFKNSILYNTIGLPMLTLAFRFMPLSTIVYYAYLKTMDQNMIDAAALYRQRFLKHLSSIQIPLLLPIAAANMGLILVLSIGDIGVTMMTAPPGFETLTIRLYNYLHYGASETVAALSACLIVITVLATHFIYTWITKKTID